MKEWIIIIAVLILTFVPGVLFKNYLKSTGDEVIAILDEMKEDIMNKSEPDKSKSKKLKEVFLDKESKWILIVDHESLDELESCIEECIAFYEADEEFEFNAVSGKAKNYIEDMSKREEISIVNIF